MGSHYESQQLKSNRCRVRLNGRSESTHNDGRPKARTTALLQAAVLCQLFLWAMPAAAEGPAKLRVLLCGGSVYSHASVFVKVGQELASRGHSVKVLPSRMAGLLVPKCGQASCSCRRHYAGVCGLLAKGLLQHFKASDRPETLSFESFERTKI